MKEKINSISSDVDMDYAYVNYPTVIKNAGLNGFSKPENTAVKSEQKKKEIEIKIDGETYAGTLVKK